MDMSRWFTRTVSTKRLVSTIDEGSAIDTFSINLSSVKCRIQQFKGTQPFYASRKFNEIKWVLYCGHSEDITMSDLVTYDSLDYEIIEQMFEENQDSYMKLLLAKAEE